MIILKPELLLTYVTIMLLEVIKTFFINFLKLQLNIRKPIFYFS